MAMVECWVADGGVQRGQQLLFSCLVVVLYCVKYAITLHTYAKPSVLLRASPLRASTFRSGLTHVRHKSSPGFVFQNQEIIVTSLCVSLLELVSVHRVKVTWCTLGNIEK